jgi:hypothetical protein
MEGIGQQKDNQCNQFFDQNAYQYMCQHIQPLNHQLNLRELNLNYQTHLQYHRQQIYLPQYHLM